MTILTINIDIEWMRTQESQKKYYDTLITLYVPSVMIFIVVIYLWCFIFIYYTYVEENQNRYHDLFVVNYV